jgi:Fe2+ or Zn2+ uptake regulation protein
MQTINVDLQEQIHRLLLREARNMSPEEVTERLNFYSKQTDVATVRRSLKSMACRREPRIERANANDESPARYRAVEFRPRALYKSGIEFSMAQLLGE